MTRLKGLADVLAKSKKPLPDLAGSLFVVFSLTAREIPNISNFNVNGRGIRAAIATELASRRPEQIEKLKEAINYES